MAATEDSATAQTTEQADAAERSAILAELDKPAEPEVAEKVPAEPADEKVDPETETPADEEVAVEDDDETADEPADADTAKRLESVQRAVRREKERSTKERADFESRLEAEWGPKIKAAEKFGSLAARARYNTVAVLRELGITEDDFERVAQEIYAHSKAAGIKPEHRAHAERAAREREQADELATLRKRLDERDAAEQTREQQVQAIAAAQRYVETIEKAASAKSPLARHFLSKKPEATRRRLGELALQLLEETGDRPSPSAVLARYETARRAELEELEVDVDAILKTQPATPVKPNGKPATNGKAAAPAKATAATPKTDAEEREEILRELREMNAKEAS